MERWQLRKLKKTKPELFKKSERLELEGGVVGSWKDSFVKGWGTDTFRGGPQSLEKLWKQEKITA